MTAGPSSWGGSFPQIGHGNLKMASTSVILGDEAAEVPECQRRPGTTIRLFMAAITLVFMFSLSPGCAGFVSPPVTHDRVEPGKFGKIFSPEDLRSDLSFLFTTLEEVHPNIYAYAPKGEIDSLRGQIERGLSTPMTRIEFYSRVAPLVARLGDGHTSVIPPWEEFDHYRSRQGLLFPFRIACDTTACFTIARNYSGDSTLTIGDRLLAINGLSMDSLGAAFLEGFSGERTAFRRQSMARSFPMLLWFHHIGPPYDLVLRQHASNSAIARTMDGATDMDILRVDSLLARHKVTHPPYRAERLEDSIMYVDFRSMVNPVEFEAFLSGTFEDIRARPVKGLIVDLRNNGGGNSELGNMLLSFLTDSAYRLAERKEWRMSAQYKSFMREFIPWWIRWFPFTWVSADARRFLGAEDGAIVVDTFAVERPGSNVLRYRGRTCFLIGPRTFSSAMMLANAVGDFDLATLIGEETGGIPTAYGEVYPFDLPNTKLLVNVSSALFVRSNGDRDDRRGILPDIEVHEFAEDTRMGTDAVLEMAKRWVAHSNETR
jgi:hypothetical protein